MVGLVTPHVGQSTEDGWYVLNAGWNLAKKKRGRHNMIWSDMWSSLSTATRREIYSPTSSCTPKSKHLKACLGPAFVTVFHQRGPPLALCLSRFFIREGLPWQSVRHKFSSERAPLGTPFVTVFHQRGPPLALGLSRFSIREGLPWHSVRRSFPS